MDIETDDKPKIAPEVLREEREEKKGGAVAVLLSKLGLGGGTGGGAAGSAGAGAGLLASKAGIVGLILAGTTVAGGIGLLTTGGGGGGGALMSERGLMGLVPKKDPSAEGQASGSGAASGGATSSLEYFASANVKSGLAGGGGGEGVEQSASAAVKTADAIGSTPDHNAAPAKGTAPPAAAPRNRPNMVASKGFGGASSGGSSTGAPRLDAQGGLSSGIGGGFQGVYKAPAKGSASALRPSAKVPATRRGGTLRGDGDGLASAQLNATKRMVSSHARQADVSSAGYGPTYDGGQGGGAMGAAESIGGTGMGSGAEGVGAGPGNPNTINNIQKDAPPPPAVKDSKNKTPYQNLVYGAIAALAVGMIALLIAGHFSKVAKAATLPPAQLAALETAKMWSGIAALAGAAAAVLGVILMTKHQQMMQGGMFTLAGGIIAYQGATAWLDDTASDQAKAAIQKDVLNGPEVQQGMSNLGAKGVGEVTMNGNTGTFQLLDSAGKPVMGANNQALTGTITYPEAGTAGIPPKITLPTGP